MSEQRYGYFAGCSASAKHKKNGSKSKKCSLPSDGLTQAQWKKRCGETKVYKLDRPISYEEFKSFPRDIRKIYIETLRDEYGATSTSIQQMLGISKGTAYNVITKDLGISFHGGSPSTEERRKWAAFINGGSAEQQEPVAAVVENGLETEERPTEQEKASGMVMSRFSLSFAGVIDINAIANSLRRIIGDQMNGSVEITVDNIVATT